MRVNPGGALQQWREHSPPTIVWPRSIPRVSVICGFSLLILYSSPRGLSTGTLSPVLPSPQRPTRL